MKSRLGGKKLADDVISVAVAKAEGNPLFAEEIATYLAERATRLLGRPLGEDIPSSLENLIMDRVQRLDPKAIKLLQTASVIGRRFSVDLVSEVSGLNGKVPALLEGLEQNGIVFPLERHKGGAAGEYSFGHVLVQDALYASLLSGARGRRTKRLVSAWRKRLGMSPGNRRSSRPPLLAHEKVGPSRALSRHGSDLFFR